MRHLVGAQFLAESADGILTVVLPLYVLAATDSPLAMSLTATAQMLGGAVAGVIGGVFADRFDRQHVLRISYLARAILLVAAWAAGPVALVVLLGVAARVLGQLDNPSFDALIPLQAREDDLQQVLALRRFIQSVSIIVGPAIGALLAWLIDEKRTMVVAACLFVTSLVIHLRLRGLDTDLADRRRAQHGSDWVDLVRGMTIVVTTPFVRRLVLYWSLSLATVSMAMAAAAVWFEDTLEAPDYWYGLSVSAYGIGAALATLAFGGRRFRWSLPAILLAAAPCYAITAVVGVAAHVEWLMPIGWLLWGIAFGPEIVRAEPEFVERIEPESRGRAYAGMGVSMMLGLAAGYAVAGPMLDAFGARTTTLVTAVAILAVGGIWIGPLVRREAERTSQPATTATLAPEHPVAAVIGTSREPHPPC